MPRLVKLAQSVGAAGLELGSTGITIDAVAAVVLRVSVEDG